MPPWNKKDPKTGPLDPNAERPAEYAYVSDPALIAQPDLRVAGERERPYCNPLYPITRLFLENAAVSANEGYTNVAGFTNVAANVPITQTAGNTYQVGIGYSQKPILKQIRALLENNERRPSSVTNQGTFLEDFLFNAITMNAGFSYGKTLTIKNGSAIQTLNSRPSYYASLTYSLDLERMWIYAAHHDSDDRNRAVNAGYYYHAPCSDFWDGRTCLDSFMPPDTPPGVNQFPSPKQ